MILLPKPLQEEKFLYCSTKTKSDFVEDFQKVFSEKQGEISTELSGKFIAENEFCIISNKPSPFFFDSGSSGHNSLKGKINFQDGKVIIDLIVKPVPRIYVLIFAPVLFGFVYLCYLSFSSAGGRVEAVLYSSIFIILIPIIVLFSGQNSKDKLRKRFANAFGLIKI